ncbi:MAG: Hsp20 family protein [Burkholderiales bacterium]
MMTTVQERFEVERSVGVVYEALCQPYDLLRSLPGISNVALVSDDVYRIAVGQGGDTREVDLMIAGKIPAQHVEWRLANDTWTAAFDLSSTGPARTAVAVRCEGVPTIEGEAPPEEVIQQGFDAFKTALRAPHVRIQTGPIGAEGQYAGSPRHYASDWRSGRAEGSMFARPIDYPFKLMQGLSKQMDRLWDQMWRGTPVGRLPQMMPSFSHLPGIPGVSWSPSVEVCEKDDQVRICMDVPGVDESNLQVQIEEGTLTIRGERQDERPDEAGHRRSELHYGAFTRRIPLPGGVDPDGAQAVLRKGVLEIRIPLHKRQPRRVPVQHVPS